MSNFKRIYINNNWGYITYLVGGKEVKTEEIKRIRIADSEYDAVAQQVAEHISDMGHDSSALSLHVFIKIVEPWGELLFDANDLIRHRKDVYASM